MTSPQSHKIKRTITLKSAIISATLLCAPLAFGHAVIKKRNSAIPQHLLNKVLKPKYQKETKAKASSEESLPFSLSLLESQFASWGVEPTNKKSSINLLPAWKTFKKKK